MSVQIKIFFYSILFTSILAWHLNVPILYLSIFSKVISEYILILKDSNERNM